MALILACGAAAGAQQAEVVAPHDVLNVIVMNQPSLSGKYTIDADGFVTFPLVGRVRAANLAAAEVESTLATLLADGFVKDPRLTVAIEHGRAATVYVVGEVKQAGSYPISPSMRLVEVLARAGWTTEHAGRVAVITRRKAGTIPERPAESARAFGEVIRVNLDELHAAGPGGEEIQLEDGDTVFVPRAASIYVLGEVRTPGTFVVREPTTVLQAVALAGGLTDRGSFRRIRIVRDADAEKKPVKVNLDDVVRPGDTVVVGERVF